jgi:hypothetical protein
MKKLSITIIAFLFALVSMAQSGAAGQVVQNSLNAIQQQNDANASRNSSIGSALGRLNSFLGIAGSAQDYYNNSQALSNGECAPDFSTNSQAMMPTGCTSPECQDCFTRANNELTFVRRQLGRLSCIYNNIKNFNNSAIAFGDNASGIHAVTGLAWQNARAEIVAEFNHFKQTYDSKYVDLIGSLERALKALDQCEKNFGQQDWYQHFGFIYLEFLKDKYKRND